MGLEEIKLKKKIDLLLKKEELMLNLIVELTKLTEMLLKEILVQKENKLQKKKEKKNE